MIKLILKMDTLFSKQIHVVNGSPQNYWAYNPDPESTLEYSQATPGEETNKAIGTIIARGAAGGSGIVLIAYPT